MTATPQTIDLRASNRKCCERYLNLAKIGWTEHNNGLHFVIEASLNRTYDLWPTTMKWRLRNQRRRGSGMESLIRDIKREF